MTLQPRGTAFLYARVRLAAIFLLVPNDDDDVQRFFSCVSSCLCGPGQPGLLSGIAGEGRTWRLDLVVKPLSRPRQRDRPTTEGVAHLLHTLQMWLRSAQGQRDSLVIEPVDPRALACQGRERGQHALGESSAGRTGVRVLVVLQRARPAIPEPTGEPGPCKVRGSVPLKASAAPRAAVTRPRQPIRKGATSGGTSMWSLGGDLRRCGGRQATSPLPPATEPVPRPASVPGPAVDSTL